MLLGVVQTFFGLLLFNISLSCLKKAVVRKWRQGYTVNLIVGFIFLVYGLLSLVYTFPLLFNYSILFVCSSGMLFSTYLVSLIKID